MAAWLYRWLPIIFGCHCRPDRSFFYRGRQFPICARCTGELVGMLLSPVWLIAFGLPDWRLCLLLMLPMLADGFAQRLTLYQSGNLRRLVTGMLFGFALIGLLAVSTVYVAQLGYRIGKGLAG